MSIRRTITEHLKARNLREQSLSIEEKFKAKAKDDLRAGGDGLEEGRARFFFRRWGDDPIEFDFLKKPVVGAKATKRAPIVFDGDAARKLVDEILAEEKDPSKREALESLLISREVVETVSEDGLLALNFQKSISDEQMKSVYIEGNVTWALNILT